jgi:hypothetical protein
MTKAAATIDVDIIHSIWDEIAYRCDICCMTWENYIEQI